jgi:hypothetical protein
MSAISPRSRAIDADESLLESHGSESKIPTVKPAPAVAAGGWDPYEVWRTRIFAPQEAGSKQK